MKAAWCSTGAVPRAAVVHEKRISHSERSLTWKSLTSWTTDVESEEDSAVAEGRDGDGDEDEDEDGDEDEDEDEVGSNRERNRWT